MKRRDLNSILNLVVALFHKLMLARALTVGPYSRPCVLVTGSTDGIGTTTVKHVAAKGYNVLIHGRNEQRIENTAKEVRSFVQQHSRHQDIEIFSLPAQDISTVNGCKALVENVKTICQEKELSLVVLMNNAGVYSEDRIITEDGIELTFAVNVMAVFVITSLLLPELLKQKSRIVVASSISQCGSIRDWDDLNFSTRPYSAHGAYSESKLFDAMLTMEFASRLENAGFGTDQITSNCLDPGTVNTKMLLAGWGRIGIDVENALDETWLCTSDEVESTTGYYFTGRIPRKASSPAYNQSERDKLWTMLSDLAPEAAEMWKFDFLN